MQKTLDYIKNQTWFWSVREDESLLLYSTKQDGYNKYMKKEYGVYFAETLIVPIKKGYPIRVFNLNQAKAFHAVSDKLILKDPKILQTYVEKDNILWKKIKKQSTDLNQSVKDKDLTKCKSIFVGILDLFEIASVNFIIIFSLGMKLAENKDKLKNIEKVIKVHDTWRNTIVFKEEELMVAIQNYFQLLKEQIKLKTEPALLIKYLTSKEVKMWINKKITNQKVDDLIKLREKQGVVYLGLRNQSKEVIDNSKKLNEIKNYFIELDKEKNQNSVRIEGMVAYKTDKKVIGQVIVIKDKKDLSSIKESLKGKILVAIETTPHYIPHMKELKGIITDAGGITSHAAIIAREMKVPCIVGTKNATKILKDGNKVEMDTEKGIIKIIK